MHLNFAQKLRWLAHLYKALNRNYHSALIAKLKPFVPEDGVMVDIGAHSGQFSKQFAAFVPKGLVYAFEPGEYALSLLEKVLHYKRLENVILSKNGISDQKEQRILYLPVKKSGALGYGLSSLNPRRDAERTAFVEQAINLIRLDDAMQALGFPKIHAMKMDIEGWEYPALVGAEETISRHKPVLLLEIDEDHQARAGYSGQAIFEYMLPKGYVAFKVDYEKGYRTDPAPEFTGTSDYIFVPEEAAPLMQVD